MPSTDDEDINENANDAIAPLMHRLVTGPSHEGERMLGRLSARMFGAESTEPERIGRFELRERIGAGAMGVVYEAWDPELDRRVALKLLHDAPGRRRDPSSGKRLLREAKAMARLRHPNVVQVHEVGTHAEQVFIAMELIEGGSLRAWLTERERSWQAIVEVFSEAGRGLAAAHAAGLVHRDFKPDNVLIEDGRVFVGDFGLARSEELDEHINVDSPSSSAKPAIALTQTGAFVGTPAYMAPEAFTDPTPSPLGDQYSFCASLYEALYGARPWAGETVSELRAAKSQVLTSAPSQVTTGAGRTTKVPIWLRRVVVRGLAPAPADRFESIDALLLALSRGLRRSRWVRRDMWSVLTLAAVVLGGAAGISATLTRSEPPPAPCSDSPEQLAAVWDSDRRARVSAALTASELPYAAELAAGASDALDRYGQEWVAARTRACEATHVRNEQSAQALDLRMRCLDRRRGELDALLDRFESPTNNDVFNSAKAVDALTPADACDNIELLESTTPVPDDPRIRAEVEALRDTLDAINAGLGTGAHAELEPLAQTLLESATALDYRPLTAEAGVALGTIAARTGRPKDAQVLLEQAIDDAQASGHDEFAARAMIGAIHVVGYQLREFDRGERHVRQARALLDRIGEPPRLLASYALNVGAFELSRGNYERARASMNQAIELYTQLNGESHFSVAEARANLAVLERRDGHHDVAIALFKRVIADLERSLGPAHPSLVTSWNNIASTYIITDQDAEAELALQHALAVAAQSMPAGHPSPGHAHNNLGVVWNRQGRHEEARASYTRAIEVWSASLGADHPLVAHALTGRGLVLLELDDPVHAREDLESAFAIRLTRDAPSAQLGDTEFLLARALEALDEPAEEVLELARSARAHLDEHDGELVSTAEVDAWLEAAERSQQPS